VQDLQSMLDLLVSTRPADRITDFPGIVDLHELLALADVQENTRLWVDRNDHLAAFAFVDRYQNLQFEIEAHSASFDLEAQIVAWGVECVRSGILASGEAGTLDASCRADDIQRIELLERNGFARQAITSVQMARSLAAPIAAPELPAGFFIRSVAGEHEAPVLVELHRAAFGSEFMTIEERLAMMRVPDYDAALDLLVIAPDGRMAAYCLCSISQEENQRSGRKEGYTDPVATHPDFQGLGLARALLLHGLQMLKERGMDTARLGTSSDNLAMQRTAKAAGYQIISTRLWFTRPVEAAQQPAG
jgi:ribosomal protein S18 acetylase RimI-like enzyme